MSAAEAPSATVELDVRPVLSRGEEPLELILHTAAGVPVGGVLALTAPFEPVPLYQVMAARGFVHQTEQVAPAEWQVRFRQSGITSEMTAAQVFERFPATGPVFADLGLDLCCGGGRTLQAVAEVHHLSLDDVLRRLREAATA